jgi:hypothetical protein
MKKLLFVLVLVGACDAQRFPILHPATGPGTAYPCGLQQHQCSDGGCCGNGFECSVDRIPSMYADQPGHGYCRWMGPE